MSKPGKWSSALERSKDPDPSWRADAACRGLDTALWFPAENLDRGARLPSKTELEAMQTAKRVCVNCPVIVQCDNWAMQARPEFGIFAAQTAQERTKRRRRATRRYYRLPKEQSA